MAIECELDDLANMLHRVKLSGFEIMCDEPETIGGNGNAPGSLAFFPSLDLILIDDSD